LFEEVICGYACVEKIIVDREELGAKATQDFLGNLGIKIIICSGFHNLILMAILFHFSLTLQVVK